MGVQSLIYFVYGRQAFLFVVTYVIQDLGLLHSKFVDLPAELDHVAEVIDGRLHKKEFQRFSSFGFVTKDRLG